MRQWDGLSYHRVLEENVDIQLDNSIPWYTKEGKLKYHLVVTQLWSVGNLRILMGSLAVLICR